MLQAPVATRPTTNAWSVVVAGVGIGPCDPIRVIAGPCSVESYDQFRATAIAVKDAGAHLLRGGAFKPRTSPYSFQGLGRRGLEIMHAVGEELDMGVVTEATTAEDVGLVAEFADMVQIGARNMGNAALLREASESGLPVLLKRGLVASIEETLEAAELILAGGNDQIVICERGGPTFEPAVRNSLDIAAVAEFRFRTHLPVIVDPSHGTGRTDLVTPVAQAGVAAGADGVIVEVHPNPAEALSDGFQSLETNAFGNFVSSVAEVADAIGRSIH
jgi:3-deoxy-7-phosphoheptulonate synthase